MDAQLVLSALQTTATLQLAAAAVLASELAQVSVEMKCTPVLILPNIHVCRYAAAVLQLRLHSGPVILLRFIHCTAQHTWQYQSIRHVTSQPAWQDCNTRVRNHALTQNRDSMVWTLSDTIQE